MNPRAPRGLPAGWLLACAQACWPAQSSLRGPQGDSRHFRPPRYACLLTCLPPPPPHTPQLLPVHRRRGLVRGQQRAAPARPAHAGGQHPAGRHDHPPRAGAVHRRRQLRRRGQELHLRLDQVYRPSQVLGRCVAAGRGGFAMGQEGCGRSRRQPFPASCPGLLVTAPAHHPLAITPSAPHPTANDVGQLGTGQKWGLKFYKVAGAPVGGYFRPEKPEIQTVALPAADAVAVAAGDAFACALRKAGAVSCWGANEAGQRELRAARGAWGGWWDGSWTRRRCMHAAGSGCVFKPRFHPLLSRTSPPPPPSWCDPRGALLLGHALGGPPPRGLQRRRDHCRARPRVREQQGRGHPLLGRRQQGPAGQQADHRLLGGPRQLHAAGLGDGGYHRRRRRHHVLPRHQRLSRVRR